MSLILILVFLVLGGGTGTVHFIAISKEAELITGAGSPALAIAFRLGRMLLTVAVLLWAAFEGWPMLLSATMGFSLARPIALRRHGSAA